MANVSTTIKLPSGKSLTVPTGLFINNQFVPAVDGSTLETINPATEEVICSVSAGVPTSYHIPLSYTNALDSTAGEKDIDLAVAAARKAFNTAWGKKVTGTERGRLMSKLADLMERDMQDLAELESLDNGKPIRIARYALFISQD
jgi:aldehyde dehydrogenase (NAD+)